MRNERDMREEIKARGPIEASMLLYQDFHYYRSGVYRHIVSRKSAFGHAIKIIGWGVEKGIPYWLCVNSWGPKWGDDGFFKILRGRNECDIESRSLVAGEPLL